MKVLLVDDDLEFAKVMVAFLTKRGFHVLKVPTALHAFQVLRSEQVEVLLVDEFMPRGGSGVLLLESVAALYPEIALALLGGAPTSEAIFRATTIDARVITKGAPGEVLEYLREVEARLNLKRDSSGAERGDSRGCTPN